MTTSESFLDLDYIADNVLSEQDSWHASRRLGDMALARVLNESADGQSACYQLEDIDDAIIGILEQPDLRGQVLVEFGLARGVFVDNTVDASCDEAAANPTVEKQFVALHLRHQATYATLLRAALPTEDATIPLLRDYHVISASYPQHSFVHTLENYTPDEIALNPRRVQAAAVLMRSISEQQVVQGDPQAMSPEEHEAFLDKYFPYQDLALTGGGGKTVRKRAPHPLK